jgi:hypothetical protein
MIGAGPFEERDLGNSRKTRTSERGLGNTNYPCVQREANVGIFGVLEICFFAAFRYRFVTFRAD